MSGRLPILKICRNLTERWRFSRDMSDEEFAKILNHAMVTKSISERDVAQTCGVSLPTVRRWTNGINTPHRIMKPIVLKFLIGM